MKFGKNNIINVTIYKMYNYYLKKRQLKSKKNV